MITIEIGTMNKKVNSTKQSFSGTEVSCALKNKVSIKTPSFIINTTNISDIENCNYIKWTTGEDTARYYWITNISHLNYNIVQIDANLDLLATYKSTIFNSQALVKYCSVPEEDDDIADDARFNPDYLKPLDSFVEDETLSKKANIFGDDADLWDPTGDGVVIMQTNSIVGVANYILSLQDLANLNNGMHQVGTTVVEAIAKLFGYSSWVQCINSCIWYPISKTELEQKFASALTHTHLYIGGVSCDGTWGPNIPCYSAPVLWTETFSGYIEIPRLADAPRFMWKQRWCSYQLETPFGFQDINSDLCYFQHSKIYFSTVFEPGNGTINIKYVYDGSQGFNDTTQTLLAACQGNIGTDCMHLVEKMQDWSDKAMTMVDAALIAGGIAASGGIASMVGGAAASSGASAATDFAMKKSITQVEGLSGASTAEKLSYLDDMQNIKPQDIEGIKQSSKSIGPNLFNVPNIVSPSLAGGSGESGQGLSNLINTAELGLTKLRRKQFTARALRTGSGDLSENWNEYCSMFGYPRNKIYTFLSSAMGDQTSAFVQGIAYINTNDMTQNESNAIEQLIANGIWLE